MPLSRLFFAALLAVALALPAAAQARSSTSYYVSLGDSYAQGVQPVGPGQADVPTDQGYTDVLYKRVRRSLPGLRLVKLGCGGATTGSMIRGTMRCGERLPYRSSSRATSQLTYASEFLRRHRDDIALVTISIGGNDIAPCATAGDLNAIVQCVAAGLAEIRRNLPVIARTLRRAAGPDATVYGSTYPDVILGEWLKGDEGRQLAQASVPVFRQQVNPSLRDSYARRKIGFVDATAAFGAYIALDRTTTLAPYGTLPVAVANICTLSWYCAERPQGPDIHLRRGGYAKLAVLYYDKVKRAVRAFGRAR